ncbi:MAG: hypothetical protein UX42_C0031G0009, partial [Microgenomates group bacterium GW2011_GWC1_46_20]
DNFLHEVHGLIIAKYNELDIVGYLECNCLLCVPLLKLVINLESM